ncbi:MAG: hypothetical protein ACI84R_003484, partial [Candidatus Azotimanducaceae bacterium]
MQFWLHAGARCTAEDKMYLMIKAWEICGQIGRPSKRVKCQLVGFRDAQLWSAR